MKLSLISLKKAKVEAEKTLKEQELEVVRGEELSLESKIEELEVALRVAIEEPEEDSQEENLDKLTTEDLDLFEEEINKISKSLEELVVKKETLEEEISKKKEEIGKYDEKLKEQEELLEEIQNPKEEEVEAERGEGGTIIMNLNNKYSEKVHEVYKEALEAVQKRESLDIQMPVETVYEVTQTKETEEYNLMNLVDLRYFDSNADVVQLDINPTIGWGPQCDPLIKSQIAEASKLIKISFDKFSAYLNVCRAQHEDLDFLTTEFLRKSFEKAVIENINDKILNGVGETANEPVGLNSIAPSETILDSASAFLREATAVSEQVNTGNIITIILNPTDYVNLKISLDERANGSISVEDYFAGIANIVPHHKQPAGKAIIADLKAAYLFGVRKEMEFGTQELIIEDTIISAIRGRATGVVKNQDAVGVFPVNFS